jgi:hypothetical protein
MSDIHCTTRFCSKCQTETARNANGRCKPCKKAYSAAYTDPNPEKRKATQAAYRAANPEKRKASKAAYQAANPAPYGEKRKATQAAYYAANPEKRKATQAAYYAATRETNRENRKASNAAYYAANPGYRRIAFQNYEAKKRANGGTLSKGLPEKLFKLQQGKCPCCKEPLGEKYHLDHIMPIHLGGPNIDSNMQLLRKICNLQKSAQHPIDFMQGRGFLL